MRYDCPTCKRIFYLEAKVESPCPACGTMLKMNADEGAPAASAPAAQPEANSSDNSWLIDDSVEGALGGGEPAKPAQPAPMQPSATSWFMTEDEAPAAPAPVPAAPAPQKPPTSASIPAPPPVIVSRPPSVAMQPQKTLAEVPPQDDADDESSQPEEGSGWTEQENQVDQLTAAMGHTRRPATAAYAPVRKGPSTAKILLFTMASMMVMLAVASYFIISLKEQGSAANAEADEGGIDLTGNLAELARLQIERRNMQGEIGDLKLRLESAEQNRLNLDRELAQKQQRIEETSEMLERRKQAASNLTRATSLLERRADLVGALQLTVDALELDPQLSYAHRIRGMILSASGRDEDAIAAFVRADEVAREMGAVGDPEAMLLAGELHYFNTADREAAGEFFRKALTAGEESPTGIIARARLLAFEGRLEEAEARAKDAVDAAPGNSLAHLVRGEMALHRANVAAGDARAAFRREADASLARAIELDENSIKATMLRGKLLLEEAEALAQRPGFGLVRFSRESQAEKLLTRTLQIAPGLSEAHMALAQLRLSEGAMRDAAIAKIRAAEAVRLTDGINPRAFALLAAAEAASGDPKRAADAIKHALDLDPENAGYKGEFERYRLEASQMGR